MGDSEEGKGKGEWEEQEEGEGGRGRRERRGRKRLVYSLVTQWTAPCAHMKECSFFISLPAVPENMYVYEGKDYSKSSDADRKTFDQLLAG